MKQVQIEVTIKVQGKHKASDYSDITFTSVERRERGELEPDAVLSRTRELVGDALNRAASMLIREIEAAKERAMHETH